MNLITEDTVEISAEPEILVKMDQLPEDLSEARFKFALKCLQTVVQRKPTENVVFCPYSIYEGLLMVYFVSGDHTEEHLRRILQLPDIQKYFLMVHHLSDRMDRRLKDEKSKGYYDGNNCWFTNSKRFKDTIEGFFDKNKCNVFDSSNISNLVQGINEVLKNEMQGYMSQPVELNGLNKNIEFILSSEFRFKGDFPLSVLTEKPFRDVRKIRHVLSHSLDMFVTELPYMHKTQSLYLLFPAAQSIETCAWEVDENISGLVERLTTNAGIDKLRKVLESQVSLPECAIYPEFLEMEHELEHELPIDELLEDLGIRELLEPDQAILSNFTHENLHLGGAMHRAYVKVTPKEVISGAVNMFFTKNEATFKSFEKTNNSQYKYSFILLIYDRDRHDILLTGIINKNQLPTSCECN